MPATRLSLKKSAPWMSFIGSFVVVAVVFSIFITYAAVHYSIIIFVGVVGLICLGVIPVSCRYYFRRRLQQAAQPSVHVQTPSGQLDLSVPSDREQFPDISFIIAPPSYEEVTRMPQMYPKPVYDTPMQTFPNVDLPKYDNTGSTHVEVTLPPPTDEQVTMVPGQGNTEEEKSVPRVQVIVQDEHNECVTHM